MGFLDRFRGTDSGSGTSARQRQHTEPRDPLVPMPDRDGWFGRRFRTPASVEECRANLDALLLDGHDDPRVFPARWTGSGDGPDVLYGVRDTAFGTLYIAIWESGSMVAGQREVNVVPTRFDGSVPLPLAGQWKMRDPGLASIGHVTDFPVAPAPQPAP